ncbi:MAG: hypothetical protein DRP11_01780 [Candidatus Aenigmatarchaeota archaeon]|nr:MAG: hypothetical protein DRP11_01780 [Candidatus Aenigmarchaeota archaeon]
MRRWFSFKKGQFFIISTILIVAALISIEGYFSGYTEIDPLSTVDVSDQYIFWNVDDQLRETVSNYNCPELTTIAKEYEYFVESELKRGGYDLNIHFTRICPKPTEGYILLITDRTFLNKSFSYS